MPSSRSIIIVGAGPTGLTAAILLRQRGYDPVVFERRPGITGYPAAHVANTRTMEVMAEIGVGERIWSEGDTTALSSSVVWVESMAGREYGVLPIQASAVDPRGPLSRFRSVNIPQTRMESVLLDRYLELGGSVRFGHEVTDVTEKAQGVEVTVSSAEGQRMAACDWLIGADGANSTVRRQVGIEMKGPKSIARFMTIYFEVDIDKYRAGRRALLYWIGGSEVRGVFISFDEVGRSWAMLVPIGDIPEGAFTEADATHIIRKAIGDDNAEVRLKSVGHWNMSAQVAKTFRNGRILLAGDSAHRFPPTGGLGMNTGIQDAHNLVWKLAAVLEGTADEALLDSYDAERRPIAQRNSDQSLSNLIKMAEIDDALDIPTLAPIAADAGRGPIGTFPPERMNIDGDSPEAKARRAEVQAAIDNQAEHFAQGAGIDLGFVYTEGVVVRDGSPPPSSNKMSYRPDAHPGGRLPFSSPDGSFARSTLAAVKPAGITLFARDPQWIEMARRAAKQAGFPVEVVLFGDGRVDLGPNAADLLGIGSKGAVAVRPDGHVLSRHADAAATALDDLAAALRLCVARSATTPGVTTQVA